MVLKKVASRTDLAILQLGHHFTKTPLGILHGKPAINSPREKVSELLLLWPKWIFSKAAGQLSFAEFRFSGPRSAPLPPPLSALGESTVPSLSSPGTQRAAT